MFRLHDASNLIFQLLKKQVCKFHSMSFFLLLIHCYHPCLFDINHVIHVAYPSSGKGFWLLLWCAALPSTTSQSAIKSYLLKSVSIRKHTCSSIRLRFVVMSNIHFLLGHVTSGPGFAVVSDLIFHAVNGS